MTAVSIGEPTCMTYSSPSYKGDRMKGFKKIIQAYLASVASVDDLVGDILETLNKTWMDKNTIVIFTSDHGWGNGEKIISTRILFGRRD